MGTTPSKSKYTHSNLVLQYNFNLTTPSSHPRILEINGPSLYEFHPDEQDNILSDLKYIISDGDEKIANIYHRYRRINNFVKFFIFLELISCISYVVASIMRYLPSLEILWLLICTVIFISSILSAIYCLYFTSKAKLKSLLRWRQSIITQISTKTLEWQTKSKPFAFTIYYPINHIEYGEKNKIVNVDGILRITLGMPKFKSRREPVYFQAASRMHPVISKNNIFTLEHNGNDAKRHNMYKKQRDEIHKSYNVGSISSKNKRDKTSLLGNEENKMRRLEIETINDDDIEPKIGVSFEQKFVDSMLEDIEQDWNSNNLKIGNVGNNKKRNSIELAIEIDDDGNVENVSNNYPISPIQPDLSFNNDIVLSISENTFTEIQSELL